jgi:hypothetical protein
MATTISQVSGTKVEMSPVVYPSKIQPQVHQHSELPKLQTAVTVELISNTKAGDNTSSVEPIISIEPRGKSLWDVARIMDSPKLVTFMEALRIDDEKPLLEAQNKITEFSDDYPLTVQMEDVWKLPMNQPVESVENDRSLNHGMISWEQSLVVRRQGSATTTKSKNKDSSSQPRYTGSILYEFLDSIQKSFTPLNEISLFYFHIPTTKAKDLNKTSNLSKRARYREIIASEQQLQRLWSILPPQNPGVLQSIEKLANLCNDKTSSDYLQLAESLYTRLLAADKTILGTSHPKTVSIYLNIIQIKIWRARYVEAMRIHKIIHPQILQEFAADSEVAMRSMELMADIYGHNYLLLEAESLARQLLQISLNKFGQKNKTTARVLLDFAERNSVVLDGEATGEYKSRLKTCEHLMLTAIQVNRKLSNYSGDTWGYNELCRVYRDMEDYEGSIQLTRDIIRSHCYNKATVSKATLSFLYWIGKALKQSGKYEKAESIFRLLVIWMVELMGLSYYYLWWRLPRLADALLDANYETEAARRYEESYRFWTNQEYNAQYTEEDIIFWTEVVERGLRKAYALQGLYNDPGGVEARLEAVKANGVVTTVHLEHERKWDRFERDAYRDAVEYQPRKKRRGVSWIEVN